MYDDLNMIKSNKFILKLNIVNHITKTNFKMKWTIKTDEQ